MREPADPTELANDGETVPRRSAREAPLVPGDSLNGIYKVERFIARGGMGEVFEGVNVETDERVAIKAIRSHLASDPKVVALFRKEARVLMQIAHPAIVQYRVFARDPLLDIHYIVTDFIDGEPITAHLNGDPRDIRDIVILARRLAAGLEAAHERGAVHRDMSPDNVLLPNSQLERAKIIDFGIAKSLDVTMETMVGDGFAGKLGYVAPEQFGDFGRQVGPWTDVYSTALVLLAYARGKAPPMGTSLSEAVERRRIGPEVIDLPLPLAPLIERMLVPDPANRIRSMREVLAELEDIRLPDTPPLAVQGGSAETAPPPPSAADAVANEAPAGHRDASIPQGAGGLTVVRPPAPHPGSMTTFVSTPVQLTPAPASSDDGSAGPIAEPEAPVAPAAATPASPGRAYRISTFRERVATGPVGRRWFVIGIPAALAATIGAMTLPRMFDGRGPLAVADRSAEGGRAMPASRLSAAERVSGFSSLLADMPCTWVDPRPTTEQGPIALSGGAGDLAAINRRIEAAHVLGAAETGEIQAVNVTHCGVIDALRPFRVASNAYDGGRLLLASSHVFLGQGDPTCPNGGGLLDITAWNDRPGRDFALISLQPDGRLLQIAANRKELQKLASEDAARFKIGADGAVHASVCHSLVGSVAIFLIDSKGPIDFGLRTGVPSLPPPDFAQRVAEQGRELELRIFAAWARIENQPAGVASPSAPLNQSGSNASQAPSARPQPRSNSASVGERTLSEAAIGTANANRQELERIRGLQNTGDGRDFAACREFNGGWKNVGELPRGECIARIFKAKCHVSFGMYKNRLYRRQNGQIQEQRGSRWRNFAPDSGC